MKLFRHIFQALLALLLLNVLFGCSMMETDLSDCPPEENGLYVRFRYDYNTQRADLFPYHAGAVRVYVFDPAGRFITSKEVANTPTSLPLRDKNFAVHFAADELAPGNYRLLALALQRSESECLASPGAKYRTFTLQPGDPIDLLTTTLDRGTIQQDGTAHVLHEGLPLDTLFATPEAESSRIVTVPERGAAYDTLSLIRDTKQLTITLRQTEESELMNHADYDVRIIDKNGRLLYTNNLDADDTPLTYTPYAEWNTRFDNPARAEDETLLRATAHYEIHFNRLISHAASDKDARLIITKRETGETIANLNLPLLLADGRGAFATWNYGVQEYLDREYQYHLDFFLVGDKWTSVDIRVDILDWSVRRHQNVDL